MYVDDYKYKIKGRSQRRVLIRHNYRENGKVKQKTIANITHLPDEVINAIKISLKNGDYIKQLEQLSEGKVTHTKIIGSTYILNQIINKLGIKKAFRNSGISKFIIWLIISRLIGQGSRLSSVRLANIHAGCELLDIEELNEDMLYEAMLWLYEQKDKIEERLFTSWKKCQEKKASHIFLYDVSSSYLEGTKNELSDYGYNRDGKKGKKQIVFGLLTDEKGEPLGVEVFKGNTSDTKTMAIQIEKIKEKFKCRYVTIVGDKGMIKTSQIENLGKAGFNYITSITKPTIEKLIKRGVFQLELFTQEILEIKDGPIRYVLHKNPCRALEIEENRFQKITAIKKKVIQSNDYLREHPRAKVEVQEKNLKSYVSRLKLLKALEIKANIQERNLEVIVNQEVLKEMSKLDGCYVIKTDLSSEVIDKETVHSRYKSLSEVEWAFRTNKSFLEVRPIHVRIAERTVAHIFICMLAYKVEKYLRECWRDVDITVEEGIKTLGQITGIKIKIGEKSIVRIPEPNQICKKLLDKVNVKIPSVLPYSDVSVNTKRKLTSRRK